MEKRRTASAACTVGVQSRQQRQGKKSSQERSLPRNSGTIGSRMFRLGSVAEPELVDWKDLERKKCRGTRAQRDVAVNESFREAIVDPDPDLRGNPSDTSDIKQKQAQEKRVARSECLNKFPKARVVASEEDDDQPPRVPKPELPPLAKGIMKPSSPVRDAPQVEPS